MILFQVLNVPWAREFFPVNNFQVIAASSGVVDDSVGPFPRRPKLSLGWVFCCRGNFAQDEVSYVKLS